MAWLRTVSPRSVKSEVPFRPVLVPSRRPTNYSEDSASHCGGGMQSCGSTDSPHSCPSWTGSPDLLHSLYCLPPFWGNLFLSYIIIYILLLTQKKKKKKSVSQIIEPVTFARCAFIIALRNIALDGYLDTRRNI